MCKEHSHIYSIAKSFKSVWEWVERSRKDSKQINLADWEGNQVNEDAKRHQLEKDEVVISSDEH